MEHVQAGSLRWAIVQTTSEAATQSIADRVFLAAAHRGIVLDPAQRALTTEIGTFLAAAPTTGRPAGYYVHGPAGRGKTWLVSELFGAADAAGDSKRRVHFHTFFHELQRRLGARVSARAAIEETVDGLLTGAELFFFDELHVHDPGGASLLNRLIDELVSRGTPTLFTSNYTPEQLLPNPVYHRIFEPGIRLVQEHFAIRTLDGGTDYRVHHRDDPRPERGFSAGRWPVEREHSLPEIIMPLPAEATTVLEGHHALQARAVRGDEVWFDFTSLLETRSTSDDFIELAERFSTWRLSGVPPLSRASRHARQRFVALIDVLVDQDVELTVLAETDRTGLVDIEDPPADLFRTESRLSLLREG